MANIMGIIKQIEIKIGYKTWNKLSKDTQYMLIGEEFKTFDQEMARKFGSQSNYIRHWLKQRGLTKIEYENLMAQQKGFKNQKEYLDARYKIKGFDGLYDYRRFKRLRKKYHKSISDFIVRENQLKKENRFTKEKLHHFIIIRKSMRLNKTGELLRKREKMMTNKLSTQSLTTSIHPTIDVCGTQTRCGLNRDSNPSKGEISMSSERMPHPLLGDRLKTTTGEILLLTESIN